MVIDRMLIATHQLFLCLYSFNNRSDDLKKKNILWRHY